LTLLTIKFNNYVLFAGKRSRKSSCLPRERNCSQDVSMTTFYRGWWSTGYLSVTVASAARLRDLKGRRGSWHVPLKLWRQFGRSHTRWGDVRSPIRRPRRRTADAGRRRRRAAPYWITCHVRGRLVRCCGRRFDVWTVTLWKWVVAYLMWPRAQCGSVGWCYVCMLHRGSKFSLARAIINCIMRCSTISSCCHFRDCKALLVTIP